MSVVAFCDQWHIIDSDSRPQSINQSATSPNVANGSKKSGSPRFVQGKIVNRIQKKKIARRLRSLESLNIFPPQKISNFSKTKSKKPRRRRTNNSTASASTTESTLDNSQSICIILDTDTDTRTPIKTPDQTHHQSHSSDSESDCEIIESITPLIVLDDDGIPEPKSPVSETVTNSTVTSSECTEIQPSEKSSESDTNPTPKLDSQPDPEIEPEPEQEPEPRPDPEPPAPLFFIDKNPGTDFEAPIYEVNECIRAKDIETMASNVRNIRINGPVNFKNKENEVTNDPIFTPNPLLSSTRLNDSLDENANNPSNDSMTSASDTIFQISINSTCETEAKRKVTITRSPKPAEQALSNIGNNNNIEPSRPNKRKSGKDTPNEPPTKKNNTSNVIVLNDTISDAEEDSVVFVSETIERRNRNAILGRATKHKALDYISLGNDSSNQQKPQSTRAKRRMEKKMSGKQRAAQAKQVNGKSKQQQQQQNGVKNKRTNRFDTKNPSTSFGTYSSVFSNGTSTVTSKSPESKRSAKKNLVLQYEKEKQLFEEKPDVFEKRMIIIDGSNVARTHGVKDKSYSIKGIEVCMKHFEDRGFKVKAVVPQMRQKRSQSTDPDQLERMVNANKIIVTPCKNLPGNRSTSYDDRFILEAAEQFDAAIVSNDNYADLLHEKPEWTEIIMERVVGFSFCDDFIMIPQDPYGKNGRALPLILHKLKADAIIDEKYLAK